VDRIVDDPADAVAETDEDERGQSIGEAGQEREQAGDDRADRYEPRARQPVTEVTQRNRGQQHDRQVGDDQDAEGTIGQPERVLNVGRENVERSGVPLVEEEQQRENHERKNGKAARQSA
jgi:hypothetical protein